MYSILIFLVEAYIQWSNYTVVRSVNKNYRKFQLACRLPLESLKIFPFSNLTRNFFRGEKEKNGLMEVAICSNTGLKSRAMAEALRARNSRTTAFLQLCIFFIKNSIKSDDKIVKKMGQPPLNSNTGNAARLA